MKSLLVRLCKSWQMVTAFMRFFLCMHYDVTSSYSPSHSLFQISSLDTIRCNDFRFRLQRDVSLVCLEATYGEIGQLNYEFMDQFSTNFCTIILSHNSQNAGKRCRHVLRTNARHFRHFWIFCLLKKKFTSTSSLEHSVIHSRALAFIKFWRKSTCANLSSRELKYFQNQSYPCMRIFSIPYNFVLVFC